MGDFRLPSKLPARHTVGDTSRDAGGLASPSAHESDGHTANTSSFPFIRTRQGAPLAGDVMDPPFSSSISSHKAAQYTQVAEAKGLEFNLPQRDHCLRMSCHRIANAHHPAQILPYPAARAAFCGSFQPAHEPQIPRPIGAHGGILANEQSLTKAGICGPRCGQLKHHRARS